MNILDRVLREIRNTSPGDKQVEEAAERVLRHLSTEHNKVVPHPSVDRIQSCEDFRSPNLTPAQKLLLEDHLTECAACRKALRGDKEGQVTFSKWATGRSLAKSDLSLFVLRFAAAAAAVLLAVAALQTATVRDFLWPIDVHATALTVEGGLFSFSGQDVRAVSAGQRIERYQSVRTGNDSGAVLELADGSRVEMGARAEIALDRTRDGVKIKLDRGNIIVTAAKQGDGHLYVE
ncbi:MAG: FecR domain-containing protein, partial [Acidobacteria bacterium]|nr:FecR domain-containing protein [Acidobacteriota bacterium]